MTFHLKVNGALYYQVMMKKNENLTGSCITHMFAKKTSILAPAKNLLNIKCCSSSSNRHIKNPSSYIIHNCRKICCWQTGPDITWEIREKATSLKVIKKSVYIYKTSKDFTSHRKKTYRTVFYNQRSLLNIWKTSFLQTSWKDLEICWKGQTQSSSEPLLK